jgi:hypothetical protein
MVIPGGDIESQFDFERRRNSRQALWKIFTSMPKQTARSRTTSSLAKLDTLQPFDVVPLISNDLRLPHQADAQCRHHD